MPIIKIQEWLQSESIPGVIWYVKRLSANDTLATNSHQAGPYIPKEVLFRVLPSLNRLAVKNPKVDVPLFLDSHTDARIAVATWYNGKHTGSSSRDEVRITNLGGRRSALLDPNSTGGLAAFAFHCSGGGDATACHVWVCDTEVEADLIQECVGGIDPGEWRVWEASSTTSAPIPILFAATQNLSSKDVPPEWLSAYPTGAELVRRSIELRPESLASVDSRLMTRRKCEYELFRIVENEIELPFCKAGFTNIEAFIARAQTILQRRKSRAGNSLELQLRAILMEEGFIEGSDFSHRATSEDGKEPDFLFPSAGAYKNDRFNPDLLRMLGVKTTCRDRWRQIVDEAIRIPIKHLLTLQEGVSESQFQQMRTAGVRLVVPESLHEKYPTSVRKDLLSLADFIADLRLLNPPPPQTPITTLQVTDSGGL